MGDFRRAARLAASQAARYRNLALQVIAVATLALAVTAAGPALAKSSIGIGSAEVTPPTSGIMGGFFAVLIGYQREFFTALRHSLVAMKTEPGGIAVLVGVSFVYGIFHAAGPGHGKAVISSYIFANKVQLRRGILLCLISSLVQACSALAIVSAGWLVLRGTGVSMTMASDVVEMTSYALVASFGAWLLVRKLGRLARHPVAVPAQSFSEPALAGLPGRFSTLGSGSHGFAAARGFASDVCRGDVDECGCGRAHMPDPAQLSRSRLSFRSMASAVLAMGLRPCSGAIVVLTFALINDLWLGGLLSVFAMALGTAITVSAIAALAVFAKGAVLRAGGSRIWLVDSLEVAGSTLLLLVGIALLAGGIQNFN
ncbi:nickel/cobalt transporter [Mangrovibrevibacter kandeliae]|uniref:nickel/cobalt transporter n=1 Tax=Mangrovibrevibacter kandeliae TaxID=2968473 RepID=UPI00211904B2|nr:nickel/cobalt transporter [Aurantimonas sp. CSK15Z-1]MCQ8782933.1 nickel/cobalt transporter [Aurantimonas sp. CSK15Z-1]